MTEYTRTKDFHRQIVETVVAHRFGNYVAFRIATEENEDGVVRKRTPGEPEFYYGVLSYRKFLGAISKAREENKDYAFRAYLMGDSIASEWFYVAEPEKIGIPPEYSESVHHSENVQTHMTTIVSDAELYSDSDYTRHAKAIFNHADNPEAHPHLYRRSNWDHSVTDCNGVLQVEPVLASGGFNSRRYKDLKGLEDYINEDWSHILKPVALDQWWSEDDGSRVTNVPRYNVEISGQKQLGVWWMPRNIDEYKAWRKYRKEEGGCLLAMFLEKKHPYLKLDQFADPNRPY